MTFRTTLIILLLALVQFTNIVDFMIIMPLGPILKNLWGINSSEFSRLVTVFGIGSFISSIASVSYVDRFDRKKLLMAVYCGFTLGTILCGFAVGYKSLLAARFLTGLFGGIGGSIIMSMVGDLVAPEHRGRAMGYLMIGFAMASIFGVPGGLWLAAHYQWNTPFLVLGSLCAIVFITMVMLLPNFTNHVKNLKAKQSTIKVLTHLFSDPNKRWAYLLGSSMMLAHFMIIPFLTDYITYNLGFDFKTTVPLVYITGGILSAISSPIIGRLSDKYGRYKVLIILTILAAIPIFGITNLDTKNVYVLLAVCTTLFVFSGSRMIVSSAQVTSAAPPQERGSFLIVNSSMQQLGTSLAAIVGGLVISNDEAKRVINYPILGIIGFAISLFVLLIFNKVKKVA
jgi:MFS transporter, DHA1 family, inner membrane transport protein